MCSGRTKSSGISMTGVRIGSSGGGGLSACGLKRDALGGMAPSEGTK